MLTEESILDTLLKDNTATKVPGTGNNVPAESNAFTAQTVLAENAIPEQTILAESTDALEKPAEKPTEEFDPSAAALLYMSKPAKVDSTLAAKASTNESKTRSEDKEIFTKADKNFVLLNVPAGKPCRKKEGGRTLQSTQKGSTCFYYALKIHAMLDQSYLKLQSEKQRKLVSQYRKKITLIDKEEYEISRWIAGIKQAQMGAILSQLLRSENKSNAIATLKFTNEFAKRFTPKDGTHFQNFSLVDKLIEEFAQSKFSTLEAYHLDRKSIMRIQAARELLIELGLDAEQETFNFVNECMEESIKAEFPVVDAIKLSSTKEVEAMAPFSKKAAMYTMTAQHHIAKIYNLQNSPWKPMDGIDALFNLISTAKKPMLVIGFFGESFYVNPSVKTKTDRKAKKIDEIGQYHIYGYGKGTHIKGPIGDFPTTSHTVAVIGVEKTPDKAESQGYVYYVDPMEESKTGEPRVIHKMSYEQFCYYCLDNRSHIVCEFDYIPRARSFNYGFI